MKCYYVKEYNAKKQYCGYSCIAIADSENINDFIGPHDVVSLMAEAEWRAGKEFRYVMTNKCKAEEKLRIAKEKKRDRNQSRT